MDGLKVYCNIVGFDCDPETIVVDHQQSPTITFKKINQVVGKRVSKDNSITVSSRVFESLDLDDYIVDVLDQIESLPKDPLKSAIRIMRVVVEIPPDQLSPSIGTFISEKIIVRLASHQCSLDIDIYSTSSM